MAYPELLSAFTRKNREGELREEPLKSILNRLETDWLEFFIIEIHDELLPLVKSLIRKPLKLDFPVEVLGGDKGRPREGHKAKPRGSGSETSWKIGV